MRRKKILSALLFLTCMLCAGLAFGACGGKNSSVAQQGDEQIKAVYEQYAVYVEAQGQTPLSYEEWLATIKGEKGENGRGIEKIEMGENGEWIIYYTDDTQQSLAGVPQHVHDFGDAKAIEMPGNYSYLVQECDKVFYVSTCKECDAVKGYWGEHTWGTELFTYAPTCEYSGASYRVCEKCGVSDVLDGQPATGHTWKETYGFDEFSHWIACETCGKANLETVQDHIFNAQNICTVCESVNTGSEGVIYEISLDGTYASVVGYNGNANRVKIADTYNGVSVTRIVRRALYASSVTTISVPDTIREIESEALTSVDYLYFDGDLTAWLNVVIEDNFTWGHSLYLNNELLVDLTFPNTITEIPAKSFYNCNSIQTVKIPGNVQSIGGYAFSDCDSLSELIIEEGVVSIGEGAFFGTGASLATVSIPNSVTYIGPWAFSIAPHQTANDVLGTAYGNCIYLGNAQNPYLLLWRVTNKNFASYTIHENTKFIGGAFEDCASIVEITIPKNVISIGTDAFRNCSSLTSVIFEDTTTWYRTTCSWGDNNNLTWQQMDVTNAESNASYLTNSDCYWYKK